MDIEKLKYEAQSGSPLCYIHKPKMVTDKEFKELLSRLEIRILPEEKK